jgi:hypothetical protein
LVSSVMTGFSTYSASHPLIFLRASPSSSAWRHRHLISEDDRAGFIALDSQLLNGYLGSEGVSTQLLNKGLPAGSMIFATMATSLFTILLLIGGALAASLAGIAGILSKLNGIFMIERHPFVFVMLVVGFVTWLFRIAFLWA